MPQQDHIIAFEGSASLARGEPAAVALAVKRASERSDHRPILVFDEATSQPVELDLRGTDEAILSRLEAKAAESGHRTPADPAAGKRRGPGRPKLGVVSREVTLLPRHWSWLGEQPGGASPTLRRLVDMARRSDAGPARLRQAQESAYRFMSAMAGNEPGFEEATRALFADDAERFAKHTEAWPGDVREHARRLAKRVFAAAMPHPIHKTTATPR